VQLTAAEDLPTKWTYSTTGLPAAALPWQPAAATNVLSGKVAAPTTPTSPHSSTTTHDLPFPTSPISILSIFPFPHIYHFFSIPSDRPNDFHESLFPFPFYGFCHFHATFHAKRNGFSPKIGRLSTLRPSRSTDFAHLAT
jgi:hypothetical protein